LTIIPLRGWNKYLLKGYGHLCRWPGNGILKRLGFLFLCGLFCLPDKLGADVYTDLKLVKTSVGGIIITEVGKRVGWRRSEFPLLRRRIW